MTDHKTGTRKEWLAARQDLLEAEKRSRGAATNWRGSARSCPGTGSTSSTASRPTRAWRPSPTCSTGARSCWSIAGLSLHVRARLHRRIPTCSASADGFNGSVVHLANHNVTLCAVSRAPLAKLQAYKQRIGWSFPWCPRSAATSTTSSTCHSKEEWEAGAGEYLFRKRDLRPSAGEETSWNAWSESTVGSDWETCRREGPGMSAFALKAGVAYHTYSAYERGIDILWGMYQWLDRAPFGRNDTGMWWRRHDEYDSQSCARKQVPPKGVGLMGPGGKRRMDPRSTAWDVTGRRNAKECGLQ
jgi:predicted dithiol-disulfide oxidoreductase (DUF899 family)